MSTITPPQNGTSRELSLLTNKATKVYIRLMFLRVGEIDTLNEKYQAQAAIEARWPVEFDQLSSELSSDDQKRLLDGKSISLPKYAESHRHPHLYIENALGDLKEQIRYSAKKFKKDNKIYVCEHRDIKGLFWEKLELQHFPADVQDLSISIGSMLYDDKVLLIPDPYHLSGVNREAFVDQQEWILYKHVDIQQRYIREFLFQAADNDDDDDEIENTDNNEDRKRSVITVTCHAARHANYFYWNGYCLILLITLVSLCLFAIPPNLVANRIHSTCTLLLTSILFRWTINRSLPAISYLTSMDTYAIICIFILVILCFWHALIGTLIFYETPKDRVTPSSWFVTLDNGIFYAAVVIFVIIHISLLSWLCLVPFKYRRNLTEKDSEYEFSMLNRKEGWNRKNGTKFSKNSSFSRIPIADAQ